MRKVIGFHNPDEPYGFLSNWFLSDFVVGEICFSSMEQYMMYSKATLFQDEDLKKRLLDTEDAILAELRKSVYQEEV